MLDLHLRALLGLSNPDEQLHFSTPKFPDGFTHACCLNGLTHTNICLLPSPSSVTISACYDIPNKLSVVSSVAVQKRLAVRALASGGGHGAHDAHGHDAHDAHGHGPPGPFTSVLNKLHAPWKAIDTAVSGLADTAKGMASPVKKGLEATLNLSGKLGGAVFPDRPAYIPRASQHEASAAPAARSAVRLSTICSLALCCSLLLLVVCWDANLAERREMRLS